MHEEQQYLTYQLSLRLQIITFSHVTYRIFQALNCASSTQEYIQAYESQCTHE